MDAREAVTTLAVVGIGVFAIVIILSLTYQGYGATQSQLGTTYCKFATTSTVNCIGANDLGAGVYTNFTKYAQPLPNTYGSNLGLAITALVLFVVIAIIAGLFLSNKGGNLLGG